ncbi:MAG: bifunctional UDP-N-acetylmuramoyl-tripeptide:D-alanyl-D-alanine ligase/alanine racemase [Marinilabiliales bacterium]|nr:MAG: bifunctional UDP-N-acetylmuramoyl-tripeptide:D-alanyl-D-alanine ligase/alanine racemase [Marinilabiliales bacterium]
MFHSEYTVGQIGEILKAKIISSVPYESLKIKDILIDSRRLINPDQCLFFALQSKRNDGHKYIQELYKKGLIFFVISKPEYIRPELSEAVFILVEDTTLALQQLAAAHRQMFDIPIVGITGSNGKTVIKEWLYQLLYKDKKIVRSPKSYNSQIGVPLSVWQMDKSNDLAVFEAGISEPEEMKNLQNIIKPNIGIFTNIGQAHDENFINQKQKIGEKLKLFTHVDTLIFNSDQKDVHEIIIKSEILKNINSFIWGKQDDSDLMITEIIKEASQTTINGRYQEKEVSITIPFSDNASIENAIHCWALMLLLNYDNTVIAKRMLSLTPIAMRLEQKEGTNNCIIINDSYNSDFNSLSIAIDFLKQQSSPEISGRKTVVILSDILQSRKNDVELYTAVAQLISDQSIDKFIGIGSNISRQSDKFGENAVFYKSTNEFLTNYSFSSFANQIVLLKGARIFEFERISRKLQQKLHETVLEINFGAMVDNLNYFRSKLRGDTKIMAMVKAFSYGSGGFEIANLLEFHNIDYLGVAYADEGVELRKAGIKTPIMVMSPEEHSFDTMIKYNLEPEIFSFRALRLLEKSIKDNSLPNNKPVKVHIKLETGMNRLGFREEEITELVEKLMKNRLIYVQSVFSHLAASNKNDFDDFSREQISKFDSMANSIIENSHHKVLKHILNSAGISRFPEAHFDMVRLGISLYGVPSADSDKNKLSNVTRLKSVISKINYIKKGESVSYNRSFIADKDMKIAVVSIGYADGLSRNLSRKGGELFINGKSARIIGDICMDMCMVDLDNIEANEGDDVIVFDAKHTVCDLAEKAETIPYEVLSRISRRVKRVYFHE